MQIFVHNVGIEGAERDFPKTVYGKVSIDLIEKHLPNTLKSEVITALRDLFPTGELNCWGVPEGASTGIDKLQVGDAFLLMKTISKDGEIPAVGIIKAFWKVQLLDLSNALWGSHRFPFIFFFETQLIDLSWTGLKKYVNYAPNYRMPGYVARINSEKFKRWGGEEKFINLIIEGLIEDSEESDTYKFESYKEGNTKLRYVTTYERDRNLRNKAIEIHGTTCKGCNFNFKDFYGSYGDGFIHVHHLNPISEFEGEQEVNPESDLTVLCPNCHAMIHRYKNRTLSLADLISLVEKNK